MSDELAAALKSCNDTLAFSSADHGVERDRAWLYGILVGWDCEDERPDHEHTEDDCGVNGTAAMDEVAERFGWGEQGKTRLRRFRNAVRAVSSWSAVPSSGDTDRTVFFKAMSTGRDARCVWCYDHDHDHNRDRLFATGPYGSCPNQDLARWKKFGESPA